MRNELGNELGMGVRFAYFAKGRETRGTVNSKTAFSLNVHVNVPRQEVLLPRNVDRHV